MGVTLGGGEERWWGKGDPEENKKPKTLQPSVQMFHFGYFFFLFVALYTRQ